MASQVMARLKKVFTTCLLFGVAYLLFHHVKKTNFTEHVSPFHALARILPDRDGPHKTEERAVITDKGAQNVNGTNHTNDESEQQDEIFEESPPGITKQKTATTGIAATKPMENADELQGKVAKDTTSEVRHIAFLKVHKAGSSTVQNILYRFGLARNLTFVLTEASHYLSKTKHTFHKTLPLPYNAKKYDIVCNHAVFNLSVYKKWMYPDAEFVAIVREPLDLLISAAYYYREVWPAKYITDMSRDTFIMDLIRQPEIYEPTDLVRSRTFNYMTHDFGFVFKNTSDVLKVNDKAFARFMKEIITTFKLVMVVEKFDESLVLLKRRFHWSLKDILYVKNNVHSVKGSKISRENLTSSDMEHFRRNYAADIKIYTYFLKQFQNQIKLENNFSEEVKCFQKYLVDVELFCSTSRKFNTVRKILLEKSECSDVIVITSEECKLMTRKELTFYHSLVHRHKAMLYNQRHVKKNHRYSRSTEHK